MWGVISHVFGVAELKYDLKTTIRGQIRVETATNFNLLSSFYPLVNYFYVRGITLKVFSLIKPKIGLKLRIQDKMGWKLQKNLLY